MFRTLYAKLALGLFALLVAVGLLYAFISTAAFQQDQEAVNQKLNRDLARDLIFDRNLVEEGQLNEKAIKDTFALYMTINPGIEIYLLDAAGRILSYSADPAKIKRERVSLEPIRRFLDDDPSFPIPGDDPRGRNQRKVFSVAPLPSADDVQGYLYVVLRGEEYEAALRMTRENRLFELSAWAVAVSLAFGLVTGLVIFRLMTRRLEHLSGLVERFEVRGGNEALHYRPESRERPDEIDRLGLTFDRMAARIARQIEELREKDAMRRRLVAHVSHDLRTPLASMRGYLESLKIKGDELSDDQRAEFLQIALAQGERLSRLVDELFELAALDAREKEPRPEPFAPAELVHDVARKHRPAAEAGGIGIDVDVPREATFVVADVAMTERVLDNLIDNAIAHAPAGGHIELRASSDDERLTIAVADDGPGIPESERDDVFEAGYSTKPGGTGLGLMILQEIADAHDWELALTEGSRGGARVEVRDVSVCPE